ncbi:MAG TPA: ABC transporter permease [Thermomicrobiales bacterium]|nr:ABC transporter permease [Thermomicrobiales bacterium]
MATTNTTPLAKALSTRPRQRGLLRNITPASRFYWVRVLLANPMAVASGLTLLVIITAAAAAPLLTSHDPTFLNPGIRLQGLSGEHWLGTDGNGSDVFARIIYGARVSLLVGLSVMLFAAAAGALLGLISGYYQRFDTPIMRVMDGLMSFPSILLAIAIMASLGPSTTNVIIALTVVYIPSIARLVRGMTLVTKQQAYVESARAIGVRDHVILRRYIFANTLSPLIVQCTFVVAFAIISEASLSFLGAGVPPGTPTWGNMLREGQRFMQISWWLAVFPGSALFMLVLALNLFGDGLRDALDPRMRTR